MTGSSILIVGGMVLIGIMVLRNKLDKWGFILTLLGIVYIYIGLFGFVDPPVIETITSVASFLTVALVVFKGLAVWIPQTTGYKKVNTTLDKFDQALNKFDQVADAIIKSSTATTELRDMYKTVNQEKLNN